jgi:hypothetical protein
MWRTHHSNVKDLECLRFDRTKKAVEEYSMEKGAQDLAGILAIKSLFGVLLETLSKRVRLTISIVTVACVLFMAW